jgi:hypothetical protein
MLVGRTTDTIRWFRERKLQPDEKKLVDDVERHGCQIISVREELGFPGWCYTVGLSDGLGCPELIVIGLKPGVAHSLLNECAGRLQQGLCVGEGERVDGLLSNVTSYAPSMASCSIPSCAAGSLILRIGIPTFFGHIYLSDKTILCEVSHRNSTAMRNGRQLLRNL